MVELFADLPPDHAFFEQFSFIGANDLPEFAAILGRVGNGGTAALPPEDRTKLLSLPFKLIPARHRLDVLDEAMQQRLLEARRIFRADLPPEGRRQIEFFDTERYNAAATVQDNILFGKIAYGEADAPVRVPALLAEIIDALGLRQTVIEVGLDYNIGSGGSRLSFAQRQKMAIARAMLKRPDLIILNEATAALDGPAQTSAMKGLKQRFMESAIAASTIGIAGQRALLPLAAGATVEGYRPNLLPSRKEMWDWQVWMAKLGPKYTGNKAHMTFVDFLATHLQESGLEVPREHYTFPRWEARRWEIVAPQRAQASSPPYILLPLLGLQSNTLLCCLCCFVLMYYIIPPSKGSKR